MLEGVKIVDLSSVVFGPYCTRILADLGAEVVKVEGPAGDTMRYTARPAKTRGMGPGHMTLNRGKKAVQLDLKKPEDLAAIRDLIRDADVFIHNVRAKAIERLGLGYADVKALRADIVYVHCVGFGSDGPYADLQAYDDVIQAASGAASIASRVDGDPRPRYFPSLIADKVSGLHATYATLAALFHRARTGEGQFVEVPMFESFTSFMLLEHLAGQMFDPPNGPICYARQVDPDRQPFPASDGYVSIVPYTDEAWPTLFAALGRPDILHDERLDTPLKRFQNLALLYRTLADLTRTRTTAELLAILRAAQIPAMPARDIGAIREDPHLEAVGFFTRREHPTEGGYFEMKPPVTFGAWSPKPQAPASHIGADNADVLNRLRKG
jgi:crotonobetainyl-CoA:carnitine CoA-transferase CaiB-like acyl-CoA transferase